MKQSKDELEGSLHRHSCSYPYRGDACDYSPTRDTGRREMNGV